MQAEYEQQKKPETTTFNAEEHLHSARVIETSTSEQVIQEIGQTLRMGIRIRLNVVASCGMLLLIIRALNANGLMGNAYTNSLIYLIGLVGLIGMVTGQTIYRKALYRLLNYDDVHAIGPLIQSLEVRHRQSRLAAEGALLRLMPHLQNTESCLLNTAQKAGLYRLLNSRNINLVIVVLNALERLEDEQAFPYVQKLVEKNKIAHNSQVQAAAESCLLLLQAKSERQRISQTLVRACGSSSIREQD